MHDVSIVVATKNRNEQLNTMLASLIPAIQDVDYEVIAIVGEPKNKTLEVLDKYRVKNIHIESECMGHGNHSWGQLYNFGFRKSDAKWIMYCSDDITFNEGCFRNAINELDKQPDTVAGGSFFYRTFPSDPIFDIYGVDYTYGHKLMVNYGLIRKDAFWEVGGLEETYYKFYCADGDLCFKLYDIGKTNILLPKCLVTHRKGIDSTAKMHFSGSNNDIANYEKRWQKYLKIYAGLNPRRVWLRDLERLERIKNGTQIEDNDSRRFIKMEKQIAFGLAAGDAPDIKEIWL